MMGPCGCGQLVIWGQMQEPHAPVFFLAYCKWQACIFRYLLYCLHVKACCLADLPGSSAWVKLDTVFNIVKKNQDSPKTAWPKFISSAIYAT